MNNRLPKDNTDKKINSSFNKIIPIFLLLTSLNNSDIKLNLNTDLQRGVNMIRDIKPYFSKDNQVLLSKIQDIIDILNKANRISKEEYTDVTNLTNNINMTKIEKKEKILSKVYDHIDDDSKKIIDKAMTIKGKIDNTKENINRHNKLVQDNNSNSSKVDLLLNLICCFKPVLNSQLNNKVEKVEKIMKIIKTPYE